MQHTHNVPTHLRKISFIIFLCVAAGSKIFAQAQIPNITDPVTDLTGTLSQDEYQTLRAQVIEFEDSTSNQLVVVMIPSLEGDEIRNFGIKVLEQNKIGQKGKDNGVLILVAKDDRKVSIEVGYGLEGVLTDAISDQIIRNEIRPNFKDGNYYAGISAAIESIKLVTRGEYTGEKKSRHKSSDWSPFIVILVIIFSFFSFLTRGRRRTLSSRGMNSIFWGSGFGGGGGGSDWGSFGGGGGGGGWSAGGGSFGGGGASGSW